MTDLSTIANILYGRPLSKPMATYKDPRSQEAMCEYTDALEKQVQAYLDEPVALYDMTKDTGVTLEWQKAFDTAFISNDDTELGRLVRQNMETVARVQAEKDLEDGYE